LKRQEAEKLIGKTVSCWTALRGCYIGELLEVTKDRPWRARVRILAVTEYPVQGLSQFSIGYRKRKPADYGDVWEFGNSSIVPYDGVVPDYRDSLVHSVEQKISELEGAIAHLAATGRRDALLEQWLDVLREKLQELCLGEDS